MSTCIILLIIFILILIFVPMNYVVGYFFVLFFLVLFGYSLHNFLEKVKDEINNQEVVNSDSLKCEPSENGDWICKKIKPVATFDANSKLFIEDGSKEKVKNNSSEEQHVILKERPLPKDNSISLKCTVTEDGTYICTK